MTTQAEIEQEFWASLKADRTVMIGLDGVDGGHTRPMTAILEDEARGPIWFFTSIESTLVQALQSDNRAIVSFASKGHDVFASLQGSLVRSHDRQVVDRLWNPFIAAWYEGKDDPKLVLLRFDADQAEIWRDGSSFVAGIKMLFGVDPKKDYEDNVVKLNLG